MSHDTILIVDFGSQVTQLIARRVREAGVFSVIAPFHEAAAAFRRALDIGPDYGVARDNRAAALGRAGGGGMAAADGWSSSISNAWVLSSSSSSSASNASVASLSSTGGLRAGARAGAAATARLRVGRRVSPRHPAPPIPAPPAPCNRREGWETARAQATGYSGSPRPGNRKSHLGSLGLT